MAQNGPPAPSPRNHLLAALPPGDLATLSPLLERVELASRQLLYAPDEQIAAVHFVETGWVSMLAYLEGGDAAEVGLVGHEGMVGLPLLLGADRSSIRGHCPGARDRAAPGGMRVPRYAGREPCLVTSAVALCPGSP